ncbi:hypothetical protein GCM10009559_05320 [Pseudonocardia zijingensis]|uniref:DUF305 domain-containing protein n=1 Tax=Pseudonocardia zijingensis TaxID=153376 RepID=A0ABP3ZKX8_9PSEU
MSTTRTSRAHLIGGALALSLALSACGGGATAASAPAPAAPSASAQAGVSAEHNEADIRFAQMMIPHHRQAVAMAGMAVERAETPDVKLLAEQIQAAQDPEIEQLSGFLQAWGADVPAEDDMSAMPGMSGMDHSGMGDVSGMMTPEQMNELQSAGGPAFDRMFLEMMIAHHEGAVRDSEREVAEGVNPQAKELAQQIISAQNAEIAQMRQMLQAG